MARVHEPGARGMREVRPQSVAFNQRDDVVRVRPKRANDGICLRRMCVRDQEPH